MKTVERRMNLRSLLDWFARRLESDWMEDGGKRAVRMSSRRSRCARVRKRSVRARLKRSTWLAAISVGKE